MRVLIACLLFAGCSVSGGGGYPVQEIYCPEADVDAPCCSPPTAAWVRSQCDESIDTAEGGAACADADGFESVPNVRFSRYGGNGLEAQGYDVDGLLTRCFPFTGRVAFVWDNDRSCELVCYDNEGAAVECVRPCEEG